MTRDLLIDTAGAGGAISAPLWLPALETWLQLITLALGVVLLLLRIEIALRDRRDPPTPGDTP